jgi:hypothetical protein
MIEIANYIFLQIEFLTFANSTMILQIQFLIMQIQ